MLKQHLQQKLQQKLSPQQLQVIRLLELPAIEIEERIKKELEENPALEEGKELPEGQDDISQDDSLEIDNGGDSDVDISLGDYMSEDDIPEYKLREMNERAEKKEEIPFSGGVSLNSYLLEQLSVLGLPEKDEKIAEYIVGNIDDDGYLRRELSSIADDLVFQAGVDADLKDVERLLKVVQDFDPAGVGATDLQECLLLQLKRREQTEAVVYAEKVVESFFEDFSGKRYEKIMRSLNIDEDMMKRIIREITLLNPKPGNEWGGDAEVAMSRVIPDFIVDANNGELTLTMNNRGVPDLRISREYMEMLEDYAGNKQNRTADRRDAVTFVKQKLDAARGFIDAVKQRQNTLLRTMEAIMIIQREFFLTGDETTLRPMILKDVAEKSGFDVSTVSRVSNSKYVQTNYGIYPLKYFFSESMQTDSGEEISTREVKHILQQSIDAEDKRKPLTDEELAAILKEKGYVIARRTVAKYREQLGIPVARLRKELA